MDHPQAPAEELTLTLAGPRGATGVQLELLPDVGGTGRGWLRWRRVCRRGQGAGRLFRALNVAPWHPVPEMRALQIPIDAAEKGADPWRCRLRGSAGRAGPSTAGAAPGETLVA